MNISLSLPLPMALVPEHPVVVLFFILPLNVPKVDTVIASYTQAFLLTPF